jgi:hypothetical protein
MMLHARARGAARMRGTSPKVPAAARRCTSAGCAPARSGRRIRL